MVHVFENVHEQRGRPLVAGRTEGVHDGFARLRRAAGERLLEDPVSLVCPDFEDGPDRLPLDDRLGVVQQFGQVGQRLASAEFTQEINRGAPDCRVCRGLQLFNLAPADGAEPDEDVGQALACAGALLGRERLGKRSNERFPERHADRLHAPELRVVDRGQVADDVPHIRRVDQPADRAAGDRLPLRRARVVGIGAKNRKEGFGRVEIADQEEVLHERDDRGHQRAALRGVLLDTQEVEDECQVETPQFGRGDGAEPRRKPSGGSSFS